VTVTLPGELLDDLVEQVTERVASDLQRLLESEKRSPWVTTKELARYSGWGESTVEKLSAANRIPGKVVHDGKVRFHLPTFDAWLLLEHHVGPHTLTSFTTAIMTPTGEAGQRCANTLAHGAEGVNSHAGQA